MNERKVELATLILHPVKLPEVDMCSPDIPQGFETWHARERFPSFLLNFFFGDVCVITRNKMLQKRRLHLRAGSDSPRAPVLEAGSCRYVGAGSLIASKVKT